MLRIVIGKMAGNYRLTGCLVAGFILAIAMVSSIPLYTDGILQKMLTGDLENYQLVNHVFPGYYTIKADFTSFAKSERLATYRRLKQNITETLIPAIPLPALTVTEEIGIEYFYCLPARQKEENPRKRNISLQTLPHMEEHILLDYGKMFSPAPAEDMLEVLVTARFLEKNNFVAGEVLAIIDYTDKLFRQAKIIGIFSISNYEDTFWTRNPDYYDTTLFMDHARYAREFNAAGSALLQAVEWNFALDYHALTIKNIGNVLAILESHYRLAEQYRQFLEIDFKVKPILSDYSERKKQLQFTLWIIQVPVLLLLFFYIFMVSNLIIENEKNEISVFKSRGKSTAGVFSIYLTEGLFIGSIALATGPPAGLFICQFMGASNGFLEFINRSPLSLSVGVSNYLYSAVALLFLITTMLLPVYSQTKSSIVILKQQKARDLTQPVWKKFFIDLVILLVSGYGIYRYLNQQSILKITGASGTELGIDPLLFLTSTLFILGSGLLFLRFFPLSIEILYRIGRKTWSPVMYCALLQVSRTGKKGQFIMLFLIFSIAIGIFDANMARTLNRNMEDRIRYRTGADLAIEPVWLAEKAGAAEPAGTPRQAGETAPGNTALYYREPSFLPYTQLEGVAGATKVFYEKEGKVLAGNTLVTGVRIQGIIPHEFGTIAWFRADLLPYHWHHYLNLLADSPAALLVSSNFARINNLAAGDSITLTWSDQNYIQGTIYAFIDYWPAFNPYEPSATGNTAYLVVANLSYLQNKLAKDPYQVWISKKQGVSDETVYNAIAQKKLDIKAIASASQAIIKQKNDPLLKGINGALTQGFILIMLVCMLGFLIYWILTLQNRTLQLGIFRAMGLSREKVMRILILEQMLITGTAIFTGILLGGIASDLFVPFLQLAFSTSEQVPPFRITALRSDYFKVYVLVTVMLAAGLALLRYFMHKLKIGSALKLGED